MSFTDFSHEPLLEKHYFVEPQKKVTLLIHRPQSKCFEMRYEIFRNP
jgi:hypothetical protein